MKNHKGQALPPETQMLQPKDFEQQATTTLAWLGNSGLFLNSRGTNLLIDPVLEGFDLPLLIDMPIAAEKIPRLAAILLTHSDNDHFSFPTLNKLKKLKPEVHGPKYVADLFNQKIADLAVGHPVNARFQVKDLTIKLTPAHHTWQNETTKFDRIFKFEDFCGFWIDTPDGSIWIPGDSRLLPEHLEMPQPDVILFDFSDNNWHIGFDNALLLANRYPHAELILSHWGTVDAFDKDVFNGDPEKLTPLIKNPERIQLLAAGEILELKQK